LRASYKAKSIWNDVIEKIEHRLASCKVMYFSKGGMFTILRVHFPIYLRTSCPSFLSMRALLTVLRSFNVTSYGMG
jgi:hypothetical protein